jgi:hypothetical protein
LMDDEVTPWSWIILSGLIILSYTVYIQYDTSGEWNESNLIRLFQYIPFYFLLLYDYRKLIIERLQYFNIKRKKKIERKSLLN